MALKHARWHRLLLLLLLGLVLSGCFVIEQELDLQAGTPEALVTTRLNVDKSFAGAEMDLFLDSLALSVPSLEQEAAFSRYEVTRDFQRMVVYEWEGQVPQAGRYTLDERHDGSWAFRYDLRPVENLSDHGENGSHILIVSIYLPDDIEFANTLKVDGNHAVWGLTRAELQQGVTLQAVTRAPAPDTDE